MSKLRIYRGMTAILNVHERRLPVPAEQVGLLLDTLSSHDDRLWPRESWPPMVLDRGLEPGSRGGHSLIRYSVSEHTPGCRAVFEFEPMNHMRRFQGRHYFEVVPRGEETVLRHTIDVEIDAATYMYWKVFVERIHDALLEDAFDKAERELGLARPHRSRWSLSVRLLRWWRRRVARQAIVAQG